MNQHDFDILLQKYLAGKCDEQETELIMEWYEQQKTNENLLSASEKEATQKRIWLKIRKNTTGVFDTFTFSWKNMSIAATIALFLLSGTYFFIKQTNEKQVSFNTSQKGIEMKNTSQSTQSITLEDGSVVELNANSTLSYPEHFGNTNREVYLKGEAFFNVKKDPTKPFIVHAGNLTTEVLGTSFLVKSYDDKKTVEVSVVTGKVSVFENSNKENKQRNGMILTPNQKVLFNKETKEIIPSIVEKPQIIVPIPTDETLIFEDTSIENVIAKLKKIYGLEIIIENQALNNCVFTGDLNDLPFLTQLELICKTINAKSEQRGTSIFINGEGCY